MNILSSIAKFPGYFSRTSQQNCVTPGLNTPDEMDDSALFELTKKPSYPAIEPNDDMFFVDIEANNSNECMIDTDNHQNKQNEHYKVTSQPFRIELTEEKTLIEDALSSSNQMNYFKISSLYGMCAFVLIKDISSEKQYLLLKKLQGSHESNHSALKLYLNPKKLGKDLGKTIILCGGEIVIDKGVLKSWNLRSGGFSLGSEYDEVKIKEFGYENSAVQSLWLPKNCFRFIESYPEDYYVETFEENGALKLNQKAQKLASNYSQNNLRSLFYYNKLRISSQSTTTLTEKTKTSSDSSLDSILLPRDSS